MSKFFVIGDVVFTKTFNVEVETDTFEDAERIAIDRVRGVEKGLVTYHCSADDITIDNISITQGSKCPKKKAIKITK